MVKPMVAKSSGGNTGGSGGENYRNQSLRWNLQSLHIDNVDSVPLDENDRAVHIFNRARKRQAAAQELASNIGTSTSTTSSNCDNESKNDFCKLSTGMTCKGFVHGRELEFELCENVTKQLPKIPREERLKGSLENFNVVESPLMIRLRWVMMRLDLWTLTVAYLASFILMNVLFCILFWLEDGHCCDDPSLTFSQIFDFCIQTSTTIGYGGYVPHGIYSNFLVVLLSYIAVLLNTIYVGLLFAKFVTPTAEIKFSNVMTYCNINGLPCLQLRLGNADGLENFLTDVQVRFTYTYAVTYQDENGNSKQFGMTDELKLLNDQRHHLAEIWTLRHVVDETSPLFGLDLPTSGIAQFRVMVTATQDITKTPITIQTGYFLEDIMIGHAFVDQLSWDAGTKTIVCDYAKLSTTTPHPVWYPKKRCL